MSRVSKACENCRVRRTKCAPPYPCVACTTAGLTDCRVRAKARPSRHVRTEDNPKFIDHTSFNERVNAVYQLDRELEGIYADLTGYQIDLTMLDPCQHPDFDRSSPLPPMPQISDTSRLALQAFIDYCLPHCRIATPPRLVSMLDRYVSSPTALSPDQTALLFMCLACGYVRYQYFGEHGRVAKTVRDEQREDIAWYRHAVDILTRWGSATFTSLHALSVMWFYTAMTASPRASRMVCAWMATQGRELGLHQEQTALAIPLSPMDRADDTWFLILFAHGYTVGLGDLPPLIKPGEFDTVIFDSRNLPGSDDVAFIYPHHVVQELVLLHNQLLLNLHDQHTPMLSVDWLLRIEGRWTLWLQAWSKTKLADRIMPLAYIIFNWGRIMLRASTMKDPRFNMSSLAILARSATEIMRNYHDYYSTRPYLGIWQHLRHIITSAHIGLLCFWRHELHRREAEQIVSSAVWILQLAEPRWPVLASSARLKIEEIVKAMGLTITPIEVSVDQSEPLVIPAEDAGWSLFQFGLDDTFGNQWLNVDPSTADNDVGIGQQPSFDLFNDHYA